jgi:C_GCAxxG_C_C family probable redox protein
MNLEEIGRKALEYDKYSGCSQSVLLALQEAFKIGDLESFKAATVLSGGVARKGETCGALLGGLMALGLVLGRDDIVDTQTYRNAMEPSDEIIKASKKGCRKLLHLMNLLRQLYAERFRRKFMVSGLI